MNASKTPVFGHDYEPTRGLPAPLPDGETILWQGAPNWQTLARRAMKLRIVSVYFVALVAWGISGGISEGYTPLEIVEAALRLSGLGAAAIGLLAAFAWLSARSTVYTITSRRVVVRFGIALPITMQIAFPMINSAGLHLWPRGEGDIALSVRSAGQSRGQKVSYLICWPHVRPWKLKRVEPMLRCIPDAAAVAQILGRALAASASQPAQPMPVAAAATASDARVPATA